MLVFQRNLLHFLNIWNPCFAVNQARLDWILPQLINLGNLKLITMCGKWSFRQIDRERDDRCFAQLDCAFARESVFQFFLRDKSEIQWNTRTNSYMKQKNLIRSSVYVQFQFTNTWFFILSGLDREFRHRSPVSPIPLDRRSKTCTASLLWRKVRHHLGPKPWIFSELRPHKPQWRASYGFHFCILATSACIPVFHDNWISATQIWSTFLSII